jgi:hypothetical protein
MRAKGLQLSCPYIWLHIDSATGAREAYSWRVKRLIAALSFLLLSLGAMNAHAESRTFSQAEMDAMLAPIALYPDPLLTHILTAAIYPFDVKAAADWSAANPNLSPDAAQQAIAGELWHPSVKALVSYPDVLARMGESPQWVADLGQAYQNQYPALAASIQGLRARAQSTGNLRSNEQQTVHQQAETIYVQPVQPNVVYAPYYDPWVVYGTWWWPAVYPIYWRPWVAHPVRVHHHHRHPEPVRIAHPAKVWHPSHGHPAPHAHQAQKPHFGQAHRAPRAPQAQQPARMPVGTIRPLGTPQMPTPQAVTPRQHRSQSYHRVPEARRAPIVQSAPAVRHAPVQRTHAPVQRGGFGQASRMGNSSAGGSRGGHGGGRGR